MSALFFWNDWPRAHRLAWIISLIILLISLLLFGIAWYGGLTNALPWAVLSELIDLTASLHTFTDGLLDYSVPGRVYGVAEQFVIGPLQVRPEAATGLLVFGCGGFALLLAGLTRFARTPYLIGMGSVVVGLALFRWEMLDAQFLPGNALYLLIVGLLGGLSYYFHAFRPDLNLPVRLAAFAGLLLVLAVGMGLLARVPASAMTVVSYGMPALLALSIGFIGFIAFEIVAGMVWLTSANRIGSPPLGLRNLFIISGLYFLNLTLIWLYNTKIIDWQAVAISPFLLYGLSLGLGIWGFRRLCEQRDDVNFMDGGAWLYAGLATLTTATIAYAFATANDPFIEVFEDVIVYTHLAMGLSFLLYIFLNYRELYRKQLAVHKVMYRPQRGSLIWFRLAGAVGVGLLIFSQNGFPIRQAAAGYYNGLGDLYATTGELASADAFYKVALQREFQNRHTNLALAGLANQAGDNATAAQYFRQSLLKQPSPQAYIGISQAYLNTNLFFEAIKTLQSGLRAFPDDGELQNNLGYLYARTSVSDSAYFYLQNATANSHLPAVPETNLLALWSRKPQILAADSTAYQPRDIRYESYQANALALRLVLNKPQPAPLPPNWFTDPMLAKQSLSVGRFAGLYNYAIAQTQPDTTLISRLDRTAQQPDNQDFTDDLLLARAVTNYHAHNPAETFALLEQLANDNARNGPAIRRTSALLLLEQGLNVQAAQLLIQNSTDTLSAFYQAVALTKTGQLPAARADWQRAAANDPVVTGLSRALYGEKPATTDLEKAMYVAYRPDDANRGRIWETIADPDLHTVSGVSLLRDFIRKKQPFYANMILSQLNPPDQLTPYARSLQNLSALELAVTRRNGRAADSLAKAPMLPQHEARRLWLLGQARQRLNQPGAARQAFTEAARLAPLDADIVASAAQAERDNRQIASAYSRVRAALPYHENHPALLKIYILLCLDQSLLDYADDALLRLELADDQADYQAFEQLYQQKLSQIEKSRAEFRQ